MARTEIISNCLCCTPPAGSTCEDCPDSCSEGVVDSTMELTLSGVTGTGASLWNATHILNWAPGIYDCQWYLDLGTGNSIDVSINYNTFSGNWTINAVCTSTGSVQHLFGKNETGVYTCELSSYNVPYFFQFGTPPSFSSATMTVTLEPC